MAFKKKNVAKKYLRYKVCNVGDILVEGVYERTGEDIYGNVTHEFRTDNNEIQVLNTAGHLNYLLNEYAVFGDYCRVTYDGKITLEKGRMKGKDSFVFSLEIDDDKFDKSFMKDTSKKSKTPPKAEYNDDEDESVSDSDLEDMTL